MSKKVSPHFHTVSQLTCLRPYVETITLFAALLAGDYFFGNSDRFATVLPHPFWIPILLMTVQYGTAHGVFAACIATAALYIGHLPEFTYGEDFYLYWWNIGIMPLQWLLSAIILGELVMRHRIGRFQAEKKVAELKDRESVFIAAFTELELLKEKREKELAACTQSPAQIFSILSHIDPRNAESIMQHTLELTERLLEPTKFSLFMKRDESFFLTTSRGWNTNESYKQRFGEETPLFQTLAIQKKPIAIIDEVTGDALIDQGLLAVPVIDPMNEMVVGMIKIEEASWSAITASHRATLALIARWAGTMYGCAVQLKAETILPERPVAAVVAKPKKPTPINDVEKNKNSSNHNDSSISGTDNSPSIGLQTLGRFNE